MKFFISFLVVLYCFCQSSLAQPLYQQRQSLEGLGTISVGAYINKNKNVDLRGVVTEKSLRTEIELALRKSNLSIKDTLFDVLLDLDISLMRPTYISGQKVKSYYYTISLQLKEFVWNVRLPAVSAIVWTERRMGICDAGRLADEVDDVVNELTNSFINDYLAANPKDDG